MERVLNNILLVLSTTRQSPATIDLALAKAKEKSSFLTGVFILDSGIPESIFDKLTDIGFTGEKPSQQLHESILSEYRERGVRKMKEIEDLASGHGVPFESIIRKGDFTTECLSVIDEKKVDLVIVTRKKRSSLSRFIFGSPLEEIQKKVDCEFIIVDE